jgi:hypothetical protein
MSRTVQFVGHTREVSGFLKACKAVKFQIQTICDFNEEPLYDLSVFIDAMGNHWEEFVQFQPWSSGPMYFLAVRNIETEEVIGWGWTKDDPLCRTHLEFDRDLGIFWV